MDTPCYLLGNANDVMIGSMFSETFGHMCVRLRTVRLDCYPLVTSGLNMSSYVTEKYGGAMNALNCHRQVKTSKIMLIITTDHLSQKLNSGALRLNVRSQ